MTGDALRLLLLYAVLPAWMLAGLVDWFCHRASDIAHTAGPKESVFHLVGFGQVGLAGLGCLLLQVNALVIAILLVVLVVHEATVIWDVHYAAARRRLTPLEQHMHAVLEVAPVTAVLMLAPLHWGQFRALFGLGPEAADFGLHWKTPPLPPAYVATMVAAGLLFGMLPYVEEYRRGRRAMREGRQPAEVATRPAGPARPDAARP